MRGKPAPQHGNKKILAGILFSIFLISISSGFAQDLGDVARQERERVQETSRRPHVYTNEDLARPRIAVRESRQERASDVESTTAGESQSPVQPLPPSSITIIWPNDVPLGDVARFYRKQREMELAREHAVPEPPALDLDFLLPTPLASPLPDFSDNLLPPPSLPASAPEPIWDRFSEPKEIEHRENTVRVERGDTLWKIAERHLGSGKAWPKIAEANPELKDPNVIQPGQTLRLPGTTAGVSSTERTIRVQAGDSLWKLAASQMGSGNAWSCLAAANPQIENASRIYPGQLLVIPANCSAGI